MTVTGLREEYYLLQYNAVQSVESLTTLWKGISPLFFPPKRQLTINGLHGFIYQKLVLFVITILRNSNPRPVRSGYWKTNFIAEAY
jgi:hypothetical protein